MMHGASQKCLEKMEFPHAMEALSVLKQKQVPLKQVCDHIEQFLRDEDTDEYKVCWDYFDQGLLQLRDEMNWESKKYDLDAIRFFSLVVMMDCKKNKNIKLYREKAFVLE